MAGLEVPHLAVLWKFQVPRAGPALDGLRSSGERAPKLQGRTHKVRELLYRASGSSRSGLAGQIWFRFGFVLVSTWFLLPSSAAERPEKAANTNSKPVRNQIRPERPGLKPLEGPTSRVLGPNLAGQRPKTVKIKIMISICSLSSIKFDLGHLAIAHHGPPAPARGARRRGPGPSSACWAAATCTAWRACCTTS